MHAVNRIHVREKDGAGQYAPNTPDWGSCQNITSLLTKMDNEIRSQHINSIQQNLGEIEQICRLSKKGNKSKKRAIPKFLEHFTLIQSMFQFILHLKSARQSEESTSGPSHTMYSASQNYRSHQNEVPGDFRELRERNKELERKLQDVTRKLSAEMSVKVASDESSVENISIKNRPMNVASDYMTLCSDQWTDAKTELDGIAPKEHEISKLEYLCQILRVAEQEAVKMVENVSSKMDAYLNDLINNPLKDGAECGFGETDVNLTMTSGLNKSNKLPYIKTRSRPKSEKRNKNKGEQMEYNTFGFHGENTKFQHDKRSSYKSDIVTTKRHHHNLSDNKHVKNYIGDVLRSSSDEANLDALIQAITRELHINPRISRLHTIVFKKTVEHEKISQYINDVARLSWKMALQRPKMEFFKFDNKFYGERCQDIYWNSEYVQGAALSVYEVHPMLYHGKSLMAKGRVLLLKPGSSRNMDRITTYRR